MIGSIDRLSELNFLRNIEINSRAGPGNFQEQDNAQGIGNGNNGENSGENRVNDNNNTGEINQSEERVNSGGPKTEGQLSEEERQEVQRLKEIDRKVRAHEMAHLAAAQGIAISGANFEYQRGPDGVNYAVGGDVTIDASKESDPEKTIDKARRIVAAALAPADPSPQDRQVASRARAMESQARMEMMREQIEGTGEEQETGAESTTAGTVNPNPGSQGTETERPHPGIESYRRNQGFAPAASGAPASPFASTAPSASADENRPFAANSPAFNSPQTPARSGVTPFTFTYTPSLRLNIVA